MTQIVGNVVDVGLAGVDGTLRVWAWFRPEEVGLIAPYRREWEITGGEIEAGVDVIPGPAAVEIDCGPNAYTTVDVTVPDADVVTIQDLFEQVYSYTPGVVSEAWEARRGAEAAALEAELSAGEAAVSAGRALTSEEAAALHAATLSARVEQPGQDILYTSDGKPYFADPAQIENVPLTVDTSVGTRVMLGDQMIYGDTGWRAIQDSFFNERAESIITDTGQVYIRRTLNTVHLVIANVRKIEGAVGTTDLARVPSGWEPTVHMTFPGVISGSANSRMSVPTHGRVSWYGMSEWDWNDHYYAATWVCDRRWPSSLPGVPR